MHCTNILSLLLGASLAVAAPSPRSAAPRALDHDDVILLGENGRTEVMKRSAYEAALAGSNSSVGHLAPAPKNASSWAAPTTTNFTSPSRVGERCSKETIFTMDDPTSFLNWDVPMSSSLHATADKATVAVTEGYSIANSVSVSIGATLTVVEDFLQESFSIDYSETWTSTYTAAYTFTVPADKYGIVVSNPKTTRHSGSVKIGCVGEAGEVTTFQGDSYTSQSYSGLSWVTGTITLCTGDTYPIPMCTGDGTLS